MGQDDIPAKAARALLGPHKILGVSVKTVEQAQQAAADGADYLGAGASQLLLLCDCNSCIARNHSCSVVAYVWQITLLHVLGAWQGNCLLTPERVSCQAGVSTHNMLSCWVLLRSGKTPQGNFDDMSLLMIFLLGDVLGVTMICCTVPAGMLTRPSAYVLAMQCSKQPPRTVQPSAWRYFNRFASQWTYQ